MLDILILYKKGGLVERIVKVNEDGSFSTIQHRPWFVARRFMPYKGIVDYREVDWRFYVFDETRWRYVKAADTSYIIYTERPGDVRRISRIYEDNSIPHAMSNIRYKARVSMDVSDTLFGLNVPAMAHYSLDELEAVFRELFDKLKNIKVMGFDIEVKAEGAFPRIGEQVFITSMCWGGLVGYDEECEVLEMDDVTLFSKVIEDVRPHYLIGFVSSSFDVPYLTAYLQDLPLTREGYISDSLVVPHIDAAEILEQHGSGFGLPFGARLALDDVAKKMGLVKDERELEIELSIDRNRIWSEYQRDRSKVVRYAETDARLTLRVGKEVLKVLLSLYLLTGISPSTVQVLPSFGSISEYAVLDVVRRKYGKIYEVRSTKYTAKELVDGLVFYRKGTKEHFIREGVWRNVAYLDFNMLYPTIYYRYLLDPEGVRIGKGFKVYLVSKGKEGEVSVREVDHAVNVHFIGGEVYKTLAYMYETRKVSKKLKKQFPAIDQAVKILANSAYGMFSKGRGGGVNEVLAGFIFYKSSHIFVNTLGMIKNVLGLDYVYGATDSFFVQLRDGIDPGWLEVQLNTLVRAAFGPEFSVKLEGICRYFALLRRKTYVCVMDGETIVKGMEKLEIPVILKDNIDEIFERTLRGEDWKKVLKDLYQDAGIQEMFVKASRRLEDLYDEEERRFKNPNSNRTKAILVKWLYDEGQRIKKNGRLVANLYVDDIPDAAIVAYYLKSNRQLGDRRSLLVLIDYDSRGAYCYECALVKAATTKNSLSAEFYCAGRNLSREQIIDLSLKQASTIIDYLKQIERLRKQKALF